MQGMMLGLAMLAFEFSQLPCVCLFLSMEITDLIYMVKNLIGY